MVITATKIERVLGDLGETPCDPLGEEKDEDTAGKSSANKQLLMLNETLIHFLRNLTIGMELMLALLGIHLGVSYAKMMITLQWPVQRTMICGPNVTNVVEDIRLRTMA